MSFLSALRPLARQALRPTSALRPQFRSVVTTRYTPQHEWVSYDDATNEGTMGVTDYAQKALGDVVFVELPDISTVISAGGQIGAVESVKAASDIYAPVSGEVTEVNDSLGDSPGLINESAESGGWLAKIKLSDVKELDGLLTAEAYKAHCEGEDH